MFTRNKVHNDATKVNHSITQDGRGRKQRLIPSKHPLVLIPSCVVAAVVGGPVVAVGLHAVVAPVVAGSIITPVIGAGAAAAPPAPLLLMAAVIAPVALLATAAATTTTAAPVVLSAWSTPAAALAGVVGASAPSWIERGGAAIKIKNQVAFKS